jgi:flagella synthesis protein FlgN
MMQTPPRPFASGNLIPIGGFAAAAAEELVAMRAFVTLLERERGVLGEGSPDALPALTTEKTDLMNILSRCAEQRAQMLGQAGVRTDASGVRQLLAADAEAQDIWNNLLDVARRAADLNAANGYLMNQNLARVDRALDAIGGGDRGFYSTEGLSHRRAGSSRSLALG